MPDYSVLTNRNGRELKRLEKFFKKFGVLFKKCFPLLHKLLTTSPNEFRIAKSIICFLIGTIYSLFIYKLTISTIDEISTVFKMILGMLMLIMIAVGMALDSQIRCIVTLSLFNFVSGAGRLILIGYIIAHITFIGGPIEIAFRNMKEVSMSIMCYQGFLTNITYDSYRIKYKPYKDIVVGILTGNKDVLESGKRISNLLDTLDHDLGVVAAEASGNPVKSSNNDKIDYDFAESLDKIIAGGNSKADNSSTQFKNFDILLEKSKEIQCEGVLESGEKLCNQAFNKIIQSCKDKLGTLLKPVCDWLNIANVCSLGKRFNTTKAKAPEYCQEKAKENVADGLDKDKSILTRLGTLFKAKSSVSMTYKYPKAYLENNTEYTRYKSFLSHVSVETKALREDLSGVYYYFKVFYSIAKVVASYGFCLVFIQSFRYNQKYLNDLNFDNCYITQYFRHIDAKRYSAEKRTVLPIKKLEEVHLVYPTETRMLNSQNNHLKFQLTLYGILLSFTCFVIISNMVIADFIQLVNRHGRIVHKQQGTHRILFQVKGKGFVAKLLRRVLKDIHIDEQVDRETDTKACFPTAHYLSNQELFIFVALFVLMFFAIFTEVYIQRFNRVVCAFFYRKWEKQRIVYLYNKTLRNRKLYMKNLIKRAIMRSKGFEIEPDTSLMAIIVEYLSKKRRFSSFVRLFKVLKIGLAKCILCDQTESIGSVRCDICESMYCYECWLDTHKTCLVCTPSIYEEPEWRYEAKLKFD